MIQNSRTAALYFATLYFHQRREHPPAFCHGEQADSRVSIHTPDPWLTHRVVQQQGRGNFMMEPSYSIKINLTPPLGLLMSVII